MKTSLITGASSGIGKVFALEIAKQKNCNIILVARRTELLISLKTQIETIWGENCNFEAHIVTCDLSSFVDRENLLNFCKSHKINLVINNAGFGSVVEFVKSDLNRELDMVSLNCQAVLHLCHHFGQLMNTAYKERNEIGRIINISSIASFQAMPYMATYAATKAFVTSLSLAISQEKGFEGVKILTVCPGPTKSEFHLVSGLKEKMTYLPSMETEDLVRMSLNASLKNKILLISGWKNFIISQLSRFLPRVLGAKVVEIVLREQIERKI